MREDRAERVLAGMTEQEKELLLVLILRGATIEEPKMPLRSVRTLKDLVERG